MKTTDNIPNGDGLPRDGCEDGLSFRPNKRTRADAPDPVGSSAALRHFSVIDQTADYLRQGLREHRWQGRLPGLRPLSIEIGVSVATLRRAIKHLDAEGLLAKENRFEPRVIHTSPAEHPKPARMLRIAVLTNFGLHNEGAQNRRLLHLFATSIRSEGHICFPLALPDGADPLRPKGLAAFVKEAGVDAWIIQDGFNALLRWFVTHRYPALSVNGMVGDLPIPATGYDYEDAFRDCVGRLVALGHRRIFRICPTSHPSIGPGGYVRKFHKDLIPSGHEPEDEDVPEWDGSPKGLHEQLEGLFKNRPPTAILAGNDLQASAVLSFLSARKMKCPEHVSVVSLERDPSLAWRHPEMDMAYFKRRHDAAITRRIVRWVDSLASGGGFAESKCFAAAFHAGNTIGPAT